MEHTYDYECAHLQTVCLSDLEMECNSTKRQLFDICANEGFFWLAFDENSPLGLARDQLSSFAERLFAVPEEAKKKFPFQTTGRGGCSG